MSQCYYNIIYIVALDDWKKKEMEIEDWKGYIGGRKVQGMLCQRDVLIIKGNDLLEGPDIVPRRKGVLSSKDEDRLKNDEIPPEYWNDETSIMLIKLRKAKYNNVLPVEDDPEMTVGYVLNKIKTVLQSSTSTGGMLV